MREHGLSPFKFLRIYVPHVETHRPKPQVAFTRYGDKSRRQRKLMNSALSASAVRTYRPLLEIESLSLLKRILADPKDYLGYIRRLVLI